MKSHKTYTALTVIFGSLSLTDSLTIVVCLVCAFFSIRASISTYKKSKAERMLAERRLKEEIENG